MSGGCELLPVRVVKLVPQTSGGLVDGSVVTLAAKPLNEAGASPPERLFRLDQEWLHQVTVFEPAPATVRSPRVKAPRLGSSARASPRR